MQLSARGVLTLATALALSQTSAAYGQRMADLQSSPRWSNAADEIRVLGCHIAPWMDSMLRFEVTPSPGEIDAGLSKIRKWWRRYWIAMLSFLPGAGTLAFLVRSWTGSDSAAAVPAVLWLLAVGAITIRANTLPCPRCGRSFQPISSLQFEPWRIACVMGDLPLKPRAA